MLIFRSHGGRTERNSALDFGKSEVQPPFFLPFRNYYCHKIRNKEMCCQEPTSTLHIRYKLSQILRRGIIGAAKLSAGDFERAY
jgi:hypothetical protein